MGRIILSISRNVREVEKIIDKVNPRIEFEILPV
jgi:hypothetical protein